MRTLLRNVNIVPMNEELLLENRDLVIDNSMITEIGQDLPRGSASVLDCSGKYIMPGLWDMHAHVNSSKYLLLYLANGVTSVRNLSGSPDILQMRNDIFAGRRIGPTIYSTSPILDGVDFYNIGTIILVKTPEDVLIALSQAQSDGYTDIKTYPNIPRDTFFTLMRQASKLGMRVVGHTNLNVTVDELIELGYHTIEHASVLFTLTEGREENVLKLARSNKWLTPTMGVVWVLTDMANQHLDPTSLAHNEYADKLEKDFWRSLAPAMADMARTRKFNKSAIAQLTRIFIQNSDNVLLGTDHGYTGLIAGFSLHDELSLDTETLGITPFQALRMGTVNAARYYGLSQKLGTVEVAKQADMILLEGNPLENILNTQRINAVVKEGIVYGRPELDAMLEESMRSPYKGT